MTSPDTSKMNAAEIDKLAKGLAAQAIEMRKAIREAQRAARAIEAKGHYDRMFTEIGQPLAGLNEAQHSMVYSMAWEHGHASGYSDVENYYGDFAELARKIIAAS